MPIRSDSGVKNYHNGRVEEIHEFKDDDEEDVSIATQEDADEGFVHIDDDMHSKVFEKKEAQELQHEKGCLSRPFIIGGDPR